jgi:hypothetical protein
MLSNNRMTQNYGRVLITCIYDKKETGFSQIPVYTKEEYMTQLKIKDKNQGGLCELVEPYFDLYPKGDFDYSIFDEFEADIQRIYNNLLSKKCIVNISGREPREEEWRGKVSLKHSRRYYIQARITYTNIPFVFEEYFKNIKILLMIVFIAIIAVYLFHFQHEKEI